MYSTCFCCKTLCDIFVFVSPRFDKSSYIPASYSYWRMDYKQLVLFGARLQSNTYLRLHCCWSHSQFYVCSVSQVWVERLQRKKEELEDKSVSLCVGSLLILGKRDSICTHTHTLTYTQAVQWTGWLHGQTVQMSWKSVPGLCVLSFVLSHLHVWLTTGSSDWKQNSPGLDFAFIKHPYINNQGDVCHEKSTY